MCCLGYAGAHFVNLGAYDGPGTPNAQYRYKNGNYPHTIITQAQVLEYIRLTSLLSHYIVHGAHIALGQCKVDSNSCAVNSI